MRTQENPSNVNSQTYTWFTTNEIGCICSIRSAWFQTERKHFKNVQIRLLLKSNLWVNNKSLNRL